MNRSSSMHQERFVQAGDFAYWIEGAQIAGICWRGREIIQRLFVTARDEAWRETSPVEWDAGPLATGEGIALRDQLVDTWRILPSHDLAGLEFGVT